MEKKDTRIINKLFNIQTPSFIAVFLSYLIFNFNFLYNSKLFNKDHLFIFTILIIVIQIIIYELYKNKFKLWQYIVIIIYTLLILILYSYNIADILNIWQIKSIGYQILRLAYIIPIISISLLIIELLIVYKKPTFIFYQNVFFIILCIVSVSSQRISQKSDYSIQYDIININNNYNIIKPILLIVVDEYNSPKGLTNVFQDTSLYNFSNELIKNSWVVKNNFYTYETSTIHSISSLFNFNLSKNKNYKKWNVNDLGSEKLMKAALIDSLSKKGVEIINYGIFDLGKNKPLNRLYYYPKNFNELLISKSVIPYIERYISERKNKTNYKAYLTDIHNKEIYNTLLDTLKNINKSKLFVYTHLYMPHSPYIYDLEFKYRENNLNNYLAYWKFTNNKLISLLRNLTSKNKYRIILTGDHGYRDSINLINPNYTFCAFYGFNEVDLKKIKSVQDIGSLVYSYFPVN